MLTKEGKEACRQAGVDPKRIQELEMEGYHPCDLGSFFNVPNTKKCIYISPADMVFVNQLRKLPVATRVNILDLSDDQLAAHLTRARAIARKRLREVLELVWYWRESGDPAEIDDGIIPGTKFGQRRLLQELNGGLRLKREIMMEIIDWFESNREVYLKEQPAC